MPNSMPYRAEIAATSPRCSIVQERASGTTFLMVYIIPSSPHPFILFASSQFWVISR